MCIETANIDALGLKNYMRHIKRTYNLEIKDYFLMLDNQKNKCAICGNELISDKRETHIDHNHKTGKVRGILCSQCNRGIGTFDDDATLLQKAVNYLIEKNKPK